MDTNESFMANPIEFLKTNTIINFDPGSHFWGKLKETDGKRLAAGMRLVNTDDGDGKIRHDLAQIGKNEFVWRRVLNLRQYMRELHSIGSPPAPPEHIIEGNYFPYNSGGVTNLTDMGQVEIDTTNLPIMSFTGVMNGCALVVTDATPHAPNKYMLYHYQSPGSNPLYSPTGGRNFPATMRCYVQDSDYLPNRWATRYNRNGMPTTVIFLWRSPRTGNLRVIAQTLSIHAHSGKPDYSSKLVQSWLVQSNATPGAAIRPYTNMDHQVHLSPF